jgi:hypothetical protein
MRTNNEKLQKHNLINKLEGAKMELVPSPLLVHRRNEKGKGERMHSTHMPTDKLAIEVIPHKTLNNNLKDITQ